MNKFLEQFKNYDGVANALDLAIETYNCMEYASETYLDKLPEFYEAYKDANESEKAYLDKINFLEAIGYYEAKDKQDRVARSNSDIFYDFYFAMYVFEKVGLIEKYRSMKTRITNSQDVYKETVAYLHTDIAAGAKERVEVIFKN